MDFAAGDDLLDDLAVAPRDARAALEVGRRIDLPRFSGCCVGDDVSWRGSAVLRCVAVQAAGAGADHLEWGRFWGASLRDLGADVAVIAETRISTAAQHTRACDGLLELGFAAVSHNVAGAPRAARGAKGKGRGAGPGPLAPAQDAPGPRSAGVVLAVRLTCAGEFSQVRVGPHGRAVAATISLADGAAVRCTLWHLRSICLEVVVTSYF